MRSLHDQLVGYQPAWVEQRDRRERSLVDTRYGRVSGDPKLELSYQATVKYMDHLLELYFAELNNTAFAEVVEQVKIPEQGYQVVDGRGSQ